MRLAVAAPLALLTLFWTAGASAQSDPLKDGKPYMSLLLTGSDAIDGPNPTSTGTPSFGGLGLAPAIGYRWLPLRAELEYQIFSSSGFFTTDVLNIRALTANVILEWQVTQPIGVYVGAGYGQAKVNNDSGGYSTSGVGSAQQFQVGVTLGSPSGFQLLLGYRRFATGNLGLTDAQGRPFENDKVKMSMALLGIRYNF